MKLSEMFDDDEMAIANKTSRNLGAIGAKAIVPKHVEAIAQEGNTILDFGAGKAAAHTHRLRDAGHNVTAHEFGANIQDHHDPAALERQYDIVYASNVLNTQSSMKMLKMTLGQVLSVLKPGGKFVANLPMSPRKGVMEQLKAAGLEQILMKHFQSINRVGGTKQAPLWEMIK
jgi:hypothetical protein